MAFAIVQLDLTPPSVEAVRSALAHTKGLLPGDAGRLVKDAYGILADRLTEEDADAIQQGLAEQGIETAVVEQSLLPVLPERQKVSQIDCVEEHLIVHDALDRPTAIPWPDVRLVAAGLMMGEPRTKRRTSVLYPPKMITGTMGTTEGYVPSPVVMFGDYFVPMSKTVKKPPVPEWSVEVIAGEPQALARYWAVSDHTRTTYLGLDRDRTKDFLTMIADLVRLSSAARINRGAVGLTQSPPTEMKYPSRRTFEEEMVWLLWDAARKA
jgi:hypothetical protein